MTWEEMKASVRRAAERELELKIGDKPFDDPQICGRPFDVHVEGKYLGWTSKERCEELRRLYQGTPSRLRPLPRSRAESIGLERVAAEVEMLAKRCREIETDMIVATTPVLEGQVAGRGMQELRQRLEVLHESVLMLRGTPW